MARQSHFSTHASRAQHTPLTNRPLALRAIVITIGAQANHGRADGLRRAGRVLRVGVALREEALRGGGAIGRGAHERVESGGVAALGLGLWS